jgi:hypothetical protein
LAKEFPSPQEAEEVLGVALLVGELLEAHRVEREAHRAEE